MPAPSVRAIPRARPTCPVTSQRRVTLSRRGAWARTSTTAPRATSVVPGPTVTGGSSGSASTASGFSRPSHAVKVRAGANATTRSRIGTAATKATTPRRRSFPIRSPSPPESSRAPPERRLPTRVSASSRRPGDVPGGAKRESSRLPRTAPSSSPAVPSIARVTRCSAHQRRPRRRQHHTPPGTRATISPTSTSGAGLPGRHPSTPASAGASARSATTPVPHHAATVSARERRRCPRTPSTARRIRPAAVTRRPAPSRRRRC